MKKIVLLIMISLLITSCANNKDVNKSEEVGEETKAEYQKITQEKAKEMMVEGNIILDVRTKEEYNEAHIEKAVLLPVDKILEGELDLLPDKDQIILVYCRSGNRSKTASEALIKSGYMKVYDFGGINDWIYETVSE